MFEQIMQMYNEIQLGKNSVCIECRKLHEANGFFSRPLAPLQIGEHFEDDKYKILFVGKTARGESPDKHNELVIDDRSLSTEHYRKRISPFWSYTMDIVNQLYGLSQNEWEIGWKRIAMTNTVKCTRTHDNDNTSKEMKDNCISRLGVIWREIEILRPKNVVFYTASYFDRFLNDIPIDMQCDTIRDKHYKLYRENGDPWIIWWHRELHDKSKKPIMRVLRTNHPQGEPREEFVNAIVRWLKGETL